MLSQTHGAGSQCWHIAQMRYCFYIGLYQALVIHRDIGERWGGKESKQELNSCVWGLECLITLTSVNGYKKNNDVTLPYSKLRELGL